MKRTPILFILLIALSCTSGYLMSRSSWIGKVGITFFHKEYNLTKVWWQGASAVFIILLLLFLLHTFLQGRLHIMAARLTHFVLLLAAGAGLYLTYRDFHNDFTHHLLGRHFHYGFYLLWVGWMMVALFFLFAKKKQDPASLPSPN